MFPFRDHHPSATTPWVTWLLIAANVIVHLLVTMPQGDLGIWSLYRDWALIPARIGFGEGYVTLLSSAFLHAGLLHLAGNMLFLWIYGDNLEEHLGHLGFLAFYLVCAVGAGLFHVWSDQGGVVPMVGASGAIAGVMGAYLVLFPRARIDVLVILIVIIRVIVIPAWIVLAVWFAFQIFGGFRPVTGGDGVAYWAHIGGFVVGAALILPVWLRLGGPAFWTRTHGHPAHPPAPPPLRPGLPPVRRADGPAPRAWKPLPGDTTVRPPPLPSGPSAPPEMPSTLPRVPRS